MSKLLKAMERYYLTGTSPATQWSYLTGLKRYTTFCSQAKLKPMPTTEATLLLFVTHLVSQNLAYTTIKVYLATVWSAYVAAGKHKIFEEQLTPCLIQVMKGIHKQTAIFNPPRVCLPITTKILKKIDSVLSKEPNNTLVKWCGRPVAWHSLVFYTQTNLRFLASIVTILMSACLFQISLWTEGTHQQLYVYILSSPKQTPFSKVLTFTWAELTSTSAQYKQSFLISQCGAPTQAQCLLSLMLTRDIFSAELDKILGKLNLHRLISTTLIALGLGLQHLLNTLACQMFSSRP